MMVNCRNCIYYRSAICEKPPFPIFCTKEKVVKMKWVRVRDDKVSKIKIEEVIEI